MMAKEKKKVPNLRFKGFTDDWEQHKLGDIAKVTKLAGFEFTKYINYSSKGKILAIRGLNIKDGKFNLQDVKYIDNSDFNKLTRSKLRQDDILFTYVGTIGNSAIVPAGVKWYLAPNVCLIRTQTENAKFISHLIQSDKFQHQEIPKWITTSSQPALSMENIRKFSIILPTISEQLKISNLVSIIDTIITLQQRKLDLLKQFKKGLLQKMFADKDSKRPVLQFKIFHDDWEQRKLGDLIKEFSIKSKIEDEYKVLSSTNSGMKFREGRVTGTSNLGYKIIKNGDLVLSPQNLWLGNININNIGKGLVSPSYKTFKLINIDSSFINPQLRTQKMLEEYKNSSTQGASVVRRNLEIDSFYQIKIFVPTISEQEKIGSFFQRLDNTIVLQHQKLAKCQSVKKSLLQQMFI